MIPPALTIVRYWLGQRAHLDFSVNNLWKKPECIFWLTQYFTARAELRFTHPPAGQPLSQVSNPGEAKDDGHLRVYMWHIVASPWCPASRSRLLHSATWPLLLNLVYQICPLV